MERRNTTQKKYVLEAVQEMRGHFSADEIFNHVSERHPSVSRGTVYRNLNILCEEGKVQRVRTSDGADIFDYILKEHYHVRCISCRKVFDVDMDVMPDVMHRIRDSHGFEFYRYNLFFEGMCPDCLGKQEKTNG